MFDRIEILYTCLVSIKMQYEVDEGNRTKAADFSIDYSLTVILLIMISSQFWLILS